jgi:transcriptional regulator with AAA-type ATPase domain
LDTTESLNRFIDRLDRHWQREVRRRSEREQKTAVALLNRQQRVAEARVERDRRAAESRIERARARAAGKVARYEVAAAELLPVARRFKYDVARLATHFGLSFNGMRKRMVTLGVPTRSFEAWNDSKTAVTRRRVNRELARNGGNGAQAARALGMGKATIRKYRNTPATPGRPPLTAAV